MYGQPMYGQPMYGQPMYGQPMYGTMGQPMMGQPMMGQPMMGQPMMGQPMMGQPMMGQPMMGQPMMGQPMMGQPVVMTQPQLQAQPMQVQQAPLPVNPNQALIDNSPFLKECPPGMQYLIPTSAILVKQQVEMMEVLVGYEGANRYDVLDFNGMRMYFAAEKSDFMTMQCFGAARLFNISILDNSGRVCLMINRTESSIFCNCSGNCVQISTPHNEYIGQINQIECTTPRWSIMDEGNVERLQMVGPCCCAICGEVSFPVLENGNPIGEIRKEWGGFIKEQYTDADTFGVTFPVDLHPKLKCLLLGAVFLIDFMYFEKKPNE